MRGPTRAGLARSYVSDASAPRARAADADEGFASVEQIAFERAPAARGARGVFVAAAAVEQAPGSDAPHLVFDWLPAAVLRRSPIPSACLRRRSQGRWKVRSVHIPAARPSAGVGRRCQGCCSRSHGHTASTRPARRSSERAQRTRRWRRPSAPATSRSNPVSRGRPRRPPPTLAWLPLCRYFLRKGPCHLILAFASLLALSVPLAAERVIANVSVA